MATLIVSKLLSCLITPASVHNLDYVRTWTHWFLFSTCYSLLLSVLRCLHTECILTELLAQSCRRPSCMCIIFTAMWFSLWVLCAGVYKPKVCYWLRDISASDASINMSSARLILTLTLEVLLQSQLSKFKTAWK